MEHKVSVESADGTMGLFEAKPEGAARGAVIVIQEAFGVTEHIQDVCRRFAAEGYLAVAPHIFHRSGDPVIAYEEAANTVPHLKQLSAAGLEADLDATLAYLLSAGFEASQIGVAGFCLGGSVAFLEAARRALGAAVTFYGGGVTQGRFGIPPLVDLAAELKTPWLGLFGDNDQSIPVDQVEILRKAVAATDVPAEIVRYQEAGHGFHCDARDSYHEASAKEAWRQALLWLNSHLAER
jgi:carboxymethylenebutenolidase